jgi:hypothetical protein
MPTEVNQEALQRQQQELGKIFARGAGFVRAIARQQDYFTGYSTAEVVQERIKQIGKEDDGTTEVFNGQLTRLSALNATYASVSAAIKEASKMGDALTVAYNNLGVPTESDYEWTDDLTGNGDFKPGQV